MPEFETTNKWNRRPGNLFFIMVCLGLGCLAILVGLALYAHGHMRQAIWLAVMAIVGLWLWLHGGTLLLRLAEKAGLFGQVRIADGRLYFCKGSPSIDLSKPYSVEARVQRSTMVREQSISTSRKSNRQRDVKTERKNHGHDHGHRTGRSKVLFGG